MGKETALLFQIKPSSGIPIYRQIMDQTIRMVASGHLKAGDELPSLRQVAGHFEINPMTISKAYSLLEAMGVLERVRGKAMVVASQANQLGLPKETVLQTLAGYLEESNE
jgi:GntR family transcriptional regulator